jgi:hypothetical protein
MLLPMSAMRLRPQGQSWLAKAPVAAEVRLAKAMAALPAAAIGTPEIVLASTCWRRMDAAGHLIAATGV